MSSSDLKPARCLLVEGDTPPSNQRSSSKDSLDDEDLLSADLDLLWMKFWFVGW
jgi:hypothetical protein